VGRTVGVEEAIGPPRFVHPARRNPAPIVVTVLLTTLDSVTPPHTKATKIRRRFDIEAAQLILGHSKPDIYADRDLARARQVMTEVD
jgi:hypothetical protein